ncbi:MAG: NAD-binding protein, partial [Pirellulales bacterium]|nr:NAD-binding protein [Pirellulales bacterium]
MADSSLPRIAILGAGPIGLEATLYARYLGYQVDLIERGSSPAENMLQWGHVRLFTPFSKNVSPLGMAALQAQDPAWQPPAADQLLTGAEFQQEYLLRLAESDLVAGPLQCETEVLAVGRKDWLKNEGVGNPDRGESPFVLLLNTKAGMQQLIEADVVIDCTGTYGNHNWLGQGGISAVGEVAASP